MATEDRVFLAIGDLSLLYGLRHCSDEHVNSTEGVGLWSESSRDDRAFPCAA